MPDEKVEIPYESLPPFNDQLSSGSVSQADADSANEDWKERHDDDYKEILEAE